MFKKLFIAFAAIALLATSLTGVAAQTNITYFTFSAAPDHLADLDKIVKAFEAENSGVKVEVKTAPYADYFTLLQTDVGSGAALDGAEALTGSR